MIYFKLIILHHLFHLVHVFCKSKELEGEKHTLMLLRRKEEVQKENQIKYFKVKPNAIIQINNNCLSKPSLIFIYLLTSITHYYF